MNENREPVLDDNDTPIKENIIVSGWGDLPAGSTYRYCPELKTLLLFIIILNFIYLETDLKHSILHHQDVIGKRLIRSSHFLIKIGRKRTLDMTLLSFPNLEAERTFPW